MSLEIKRLQQILESAFGRAFLAHILGLNAWEIISGQTSVSEISARAKNFDVPTMRGKLFSSYADFIREYPFGYTHDWTQLTAQLDEAKSDLAQVLTRIAPELLALGFAAVFDKTKQYAVLSDKCSPSDQAEFQTIWKSNAGAWWTHPNTLPSFQGHAADLDNFAIDDAMIYPTQMAQLVLNGAPDVFEIHSALEWVSLVLRFPDRVKVEHLENWTTSVPWREGQIWIPNWREVAGSYQGVYLSPAAYLGISYSPLKLPDGRVTFLSGWSPGATFWFPESEN